MTDLVGTHALEDAAQPCAVGEVPGRNRRVSGDIHPTSVTVDGAHALEDAVEFLLGKGS